MQINSEFQPISVNKSKYSDYNLKPTPHMQILDPEKELCWTGLEMLLLYRLKNYYRNEEKCWCEHIKEGIIKDHNCYWNILARYFKNLLLKIIIFLFMWINKFDCQKANKVINTNKHRIMNWGRIIGYLVICLLYLHIY